MSWPEEIRELILSTFGNDQKKAYGQIATTSPSGAPSVRTVHIHAISSSFLAVNSNIQSEKWKSLRSNNHIGGCFWNESNQTQFRFEGTAQLLVENPKDHPDLLQKMWLKMRKEVRVTYLLDEKKIPLQTPNVDVDPETRSKNHGVILIQTHLWDVFHNHAKEYRFGTRTLYVHKNGSWQNRQVNSLHSAP